MDNFYMDLKNMDTVVENFDALAIKCAAIANGYHQDYQIVSDQEWNGAARAMFNTVSESLEMQLWDVADSVASISEKLVKAGKQYMQADMDAAKAMPGITRRFDEKATFYNPDTGKIESVDYTGEYTPEPHYGSKDGADYGSYDGTDPGLFHDGIGD